VLEERATCIDEGTIDAKDGGSLFAVDLGLALVEREDGLVIALFEVDVPGAEDVVFLAPLGEFALEDGDECFEILETHDDPLLWRVV